MTRFAIALSLTLVTAPAFAQQKPPEKKVTPTPAQMKTNTRVSDCMKDAEKRKIPPEQVKDHVRSCMQG